jgi:2-polyprenyl-6-methoxyphenol hydroxylase-like FAD-dependent oxidoreductase
MKSILISGASVAGTTLAYWLQRRGFAVSVVERASAPRQGGYAVDVRGSAIAVLDRMGVLARARQQHCDTLGTSFLAPDGRAAATMERGFGVISAEDIEIMRGDLVQILYEASLPGVDYRFCDSIARLEPDDHGVLVHFENAEPRRFDLVVGADGLHSNVRRLAFGDESQFVHHLGCYMAVFTIPNHLGLERWQHIYNVPHRVVSVKSDTGNRTLKVTVFFSSPKLDYDYRDIAQQKQLTATAFADVGWELPRITASMRAADDFYFDSTSQVRMDSWSRGRITLVGDACACPSPLAGQGSSMALVGAYVLAAELAANSGAPELALANYERRARSFIEQNLKVSRDLAESFTPSSRFAIWSRNMSLAMLRYLPGTQHIMRFAMRDLIRATTAIELPDVPAQAGRQSSFECTSALVG